MRLTDSKTKTKNRKEIIMKRLFSFMLVLILVLSMSAVAFAAGGTGTITITNATKEVEYNLFKFFDATYAVDSHGNTIVDADGKAVVSYTIETTNQFFDDMFGTDGKTANDYFTYDAESHVVTKKAGVQDSAVIDYLDELAKNADPDETIKATSDEVIFTGLDTGYYLIDRGIDSTVTITTNMPDVKVIDKNQTPNVNDSFSKLVYDEDTGNWVESSSAKIGDIIDWEIDFIATNYDGDEIVMYYSIRDNKDSGLWVEFDDITVTVGSNTLTKGYYYCADSTIATGEWGLLGDGWPAGADYDTTNPNEAQWYLIHYGYDEFEIVIPWLDDHTFTGVQSSTKGYELTFDLDEKDGNSILSESIYSSPINVKLEYSASVGPDAANTTSKNEAELDWVTPEGTTGPDDSEVTETKVYNMGITKTANDGTSTTPATRLAGAVFELYADAACTQPINVIPTGVDGVYILDDVDTIVSGTNRTTAREKYAGKWETYIENDPTPADPTDPKNTDNNRRNDVETLASGQIVIMGLETGTYYLKETKAPEGYNQLTSPVAATVGTGATSTFENGYTVYNTTIVNNRGVELPSTGGQGTMMMITIGTMVAMAFAVLLITHKKMSVYHD